MSGIILLLPHTPSWRGEGQLQLYLHNYVITMPLSADAEGVQPVQTTGARHFERGQRPDYVTYAFVFLGGTIICRLQKLTLSDQAHVILQLKVSIYDLVHRLLAGPPLVGGGTPPFFHRGLSPLSAALIPFNHVVHCQLG